MPRWTINTQFMVAAETPDAALAWLRGAPASVATRAPLWSPLLVVVPARVKAR